MHVVQIQECMQPHLYTHISWNKRMAVEVGERGSRLVASQLISLAVQIACFNSC